MPQSFIVTERVRDIDSSEEGTIIDINRLGCLHSVCVQFDNPNYPYPSNNIKAYFQDDLDIKLLKI